MRSRIIAADNATMARFSALRGLAGIAIASTTTNVLGKGLTGRRRPVSEVPLPRITSSPSGHAASAAAGGARGTRRREGHPGQDLAPDGSPVRFCADGEVVTGKSAIMLRKRRHPLLVYRPDARPGGWARAV